MITGSKYISSNKLIILIAIFLTLFYNITFFTNLVRAYPLNLNNLGFIVSTALVLVCAFILLLSFTCYRKTIKPIIITLLIVSASSAYFMDSYNVVIDDQMIQNMVMTDASEAMDLVSLKLAMYLLLLGIVPSIFVYRIAIEKRPIRQAIMSRIILSVAVLSLAVAVVFMFSSHYASFIREHKPLRYYTNPTTFIYSIIKYAKSFTKNKIDVLQPIGQDAKIPADDEHRELIIFIVGESARYDRFSLNGYQKETNPLLKQEDVISYNNFWSCGTSTAVSVPCMFSIYSRSEYDSSKVQSTENVLDILQRSGVNVLWRDNNSSSKGVALRVPYESFRTADTNPLCDGECRDEGMLNGLQRYINNHKSGDIFIVLHQLGNHGPAYYKRYPASFERFTPVCKTNQLEECSKEEISNTYDNIILYTDYFLSKVIALLKENSANFETGMMYVSDHGESLEENRLFLHGLL